MGVDIKSERTCTISAEGMEITDINSEILKFTPEQIFEYAEWIKKFQRKKISPRQMAKWIKKTKRKFKSNLKLIQGY